MTYYQPMSVIQRSQTTTLTDAKGMIVGNAAGSDGLRACQPIATEEVVTVRDYGTPMRIWYEPGFLEANKIGFTTNADGALLGVNTESTPDQGNTLKNLAGAAASVAAAAHAFTVAPELAPTTLSPPGKAAGPLAACNSGSTIVGARPFTITR